MDITTLKELITHLTNLGRELYVDPARRTRIYSIDERNMTSSPILDRRSISETVPSFGSRNVRAVQDANNQLLFYEEQSKTSPNANAPKRN